MKMDDLRNFLELLEEFDEVQRIKVPVDWNLEMGATRDGVITLARRRRCSRTSKVIRRDSDAGRAVGRKQEARAFVICSHCIGAEPATQRVSKRNYANLFAT
jgi:hypothetical protein